MFARRIVAAAVSLLSLGLFAASVASQPREDALGVETVRWHAAQSRARDLRRS
jgi:hypothetical protein